MTLAQQQNDIRHSQQVHYLLIKGAITGIILLARLKLQVVNKCITAMYFSV